MNSNRLFLLKNATVLDYKLTVKSAFKFKVQHCSASK